MCLIVPVQSFGSIVFFLGSRGDERLRNRIDLVDWLWRSPTGRGQSGTHPLGVGSVLLEVRASVLARRLILN